MDSNTVNYLYKVYIGPDFAGGFYTRGEAFDFVNILIRYKMDGNGSFYAELQSLKEALMKHKKIAEIVMTEDFPKEVPMYIVNLILKQYDLRIVCP